MNTSVFHNFNSTKLDKTAPVIRSSPSDVGVFKCVYLFIIII